MKDKEVPEDWQPSNRKPSEKEMERVFKAYAEKAFGTPFDKALRLLEIDAEVKAMEDQLFLLIDEPDPERKTLLKNEIASLLKEQKDINRLASTSGERSAAQQRQVDLIEKVRELMQGEIDSGAWPKEKLGKEGFLKFIWRKHEPAIKRTYGDVEYDTIRRKTTPEDCRNLGLKPLPKG